MLSVLRYYKHVTTDDVLNHIRRVYGEDDDYYEDDAHVMGVRHRVSEEIDHVRWREHINHDHVHEIQMPEHDHTCLWKWGCGQWWTPVFCSLRCTIRAELYEFLIRFPQIIVVMDEIDLQVSLTTVAIFSYFFQSIPVHEIIVSTDLLCLCLLLSVRHNL
jgi:hypothetical protein